jgi:DNA-binding transcriptional ArsR family regulator
MKLGPDISYIASQIGDPSRASMLTALMSGQALTANELAIEAGIQAPTASSHLSKLIEAGLIAPEKQGRHRYFRIANVKVAEMLETLLVLSGEVGPKRVRFGPKEPALRQARVCYDHIAGELGVRLYESMSVRGFLNFEDGDIALSGKGLCFARDLGISEAELQTKRRPVCRSCLDWSERRYHMAGLFGAAILNVLTQNGWIKREEKSRILRVSISGDKALKHFFPY